MATNSFSPSKPLTPRDRLVGLVEGALLADALALPAHWMYEPGEIVEKYGRVETLLAPPGDGYHPGKGAGDQTHLGDQTLLLLDSLAACEGCFSVDDFARRWSEFWPTSRAYRDHATKETLANLEKGLPLARAGSASVELAGPARIAPLLVALRSEEEPTLIAAVRAQTALTHNSPLALDAAEWIARTALLLLRGVSIASALRMSSDLPYRTLPAPAYLAQAEAVQTESTVEAVEALGQSCPMEKSIPAVMLILLQHGENLRTALIENVMAGGDSAARGLVLGTLLGAGLGRGAIPAEWRTAWQGRSRAEAFFQASGLGIDEIAKAQA